MKLWRRDPGSRVDFIISTINHVAGAVLLVALAVILMLLAAEVFATRGG